MTEIKVVLQDVFGDDRVIANSAWTSSTLIDNKDAKSDEDVARVVKMLAEQQHGVPFESVVFRFWLSVPIAIDRQIEKHRISSQNGMSARYRTMPTEFLPIGHDVLNIIDKAPLETNVAAEYDSLCWQANHFYKTVSNHFKAASKENIITNAEYKRVREFFRGVLPQHNMTEKVITINLRSLSNFLKLRNSEFAQPEIQFVAKLMLEEVKKFNKCPVAIEALEKAGWVI